MKSLPQKQKITIGGSTLEYVKAGAGAPIIVLINGSGGPIEGWHRVFHDLATLGTVFGYNRLGIGKSSKPAEPQTGAVMVETLRTLLLKIELSPPYLLVGHSLGGLVANLFARCHPREVSGVVFLDATAPEDIAVMAAYESPLQKSLKNAIEKVSRRDTLGETAHVPRTVELIGQAPSFPSIPVVVVTGGKPAMSWLIPAPVLAARAEHQHRLASLSPRCKQVVATKSGHFPQFSEPEVVIHAVQEAIELGRITHDKKQYFQQG